MIMKKSFIIVCLAFSTWAFSQGPLVSNVSNYIIDPSISSTLVLSGSNFPNKNSLKVFLGYTQVTVDDATSTSISVTVPAGAGGLVKVVDVSSNLVHNSRFHVMTLQSEVYDVSRSYTQANFVQKFSSNLSRLISAYDGNEYGQYTRPFGIFDMNNDGKVDIVKVTGDDPSSVGCDIYLNTSTSGSFSINSTPYHISSTASDMMVIEDFDGDGLMDLALADEVNSVIEIFRNTSNSGVLSFNQTAIQIQLSNIEVHRFRAADVNSDGKIDLVYGDYYISSYDVSYNNSSNNSISFAAQTTLINGFSGSRSIEFADVNNDGKVDLLVGNAGVYLNSGSGFGSAIGPYSSYYTNSTFGDLDYNGTIDIVAPQQGGNYSDGAIFINSFSSVFDQNSLSPVSISGTDEGWRGIDVSDINGDGFLDVLFSGTSYLSVALNKISSVGQSVSGSTWDPEMLYNMISYGNSAGSFVVDFDGDGKRDVLTLEYGNPSIFKVFSLQKKHAHIQ
jgi:hypothetical protein